MRQSGVAPGAPGAPRGRSRHRRFSFALALALLAALARAGGTQRLDGVAEVTIDGPGNIEASVRVRREGFAPQGADTLRGEQARAALRKEGKRALSRWNRSSQFVDVRELSDSALVRTVEWRYRILAPIAGVGTMRVPLAMWPNSELADACSPPSAGQHLTVGSEFSVTTRLALPVRATVDSLPAPLHLENEFGEASCATRRLEHGLEWTWTYVVRADSALAAAPAEDLLRLANAASRSLAAVVEVRLNGSEVHSRIPIGVPSVGHTHGGGGGHH